MLCKIAAVLLLAQVALAQLPPGVDEQQLYQAVMPYDQYAQGYGNTGNGGSGHVERIDNQPVQLPDQEETRQGQDQVMDTQLADEHRDARVDNTKEIHNYQIQKRIINVNNRILHRYLKNLLVNTIYNTNIQKVNHQKLINLLLNTLQETHQPKLLVKYSRQDTTNDLGERSEQPEVSEDRQDKVLPPQFIPATVEKIGYDGLALGSGISAGGSSGLSSSSASSSGFASGRSGLDSYSSGLGGNYGSGIGGGYSSSGSQGYSSGADMSSYGTSGSSGITGRSSNYDSSNSVGGGYSTNQGYSSPSTYSSNQGYSSQGYSTNQGF